MKLVSILISTGMLLSLAGQTPAQGSIRDLLDPTQKENARKKFKSSDEILDLLETLDTAQMGVGVFADYAVQQEIQLDAMQRRSASQAFRQAISDATRDAQSHAEGQATVAQFTGTIIFPNITQGIVSEQVRRSNVAMEHNLRVAFELFYEGELEVEQRIRFHQVMFQIMGPNRAILKAIGGTEEQLKKLIEAYGKLPEAIAKVTHVDPMKKNALQTAALADARLVALKSVLTTDQIAAWRELVGPQLVYGGAFNRIKK